MLTSPPTTSPSPQTVSTPPSSPWPAPLLASKFHYFVEDMSLCRRWAFGGELQADEGETCRAEDCTACYRKLEKRRANKAKETQRG